MWASGEGERICSGIFGLDSIIKEDIPEVAPAQPEAFVKRARCPKCQGVLELKGRKLVSECGWVLEFGKRPTG